MTRLKYNWESSDMITT